MSVEKVVLVGSGSSSSTPKLKCITSPNPCKQCVEALNDPNSKNHRLNPSLLIQYRSTPGGELFNLLIDCTKTFRESVLRVLHPLHVSKLKAVLLTHEHADACHGLDDLREFSPLPVYAPQDTIHSLQGMFPYLFTKCKTWVADIEWRSIRPTEPFIVDGGLEIMPVPMVHGPTAIAMGYVIRTCPNGDEAPSSGSARPDRSRGCIIYLSDVSEISAEQFAFFSALRPVNLLIIDLLSMRGNISHFGLEQSTAAAERIGAARTVFTGMGHDLSHDGLSQLLQSRGLDRCSVGYDGMVVWERTSVGVARY